MGALMQLDFALIALAALLLAFTAISKLWASTQLVEFIPPIFASLAVGLVTLLFTMGGGIRTSIFTGSSMTIMWTAFIAALTYLAFSADPSFLAVTGKNSLTTIFDVKFQTTYAVALLFTMLVAATSHGMMWQKAFSMPKEKIMPAFLTGAGVFSFIVFFLGALSLYAFKANLHLTSPEGGSMAGMLALGGPVAIVLFGALLIGQTSTVIDSSLNYISSLVTMEWIKKDSVWISRVIMAVFMLLAWSISYAGIDIWTIMMLMGAIRVVMFVPLLLTALNCKLNESITFYSSIVGVVGALWLEYISKFEKLPIFDMYSVLFALGVPLLAFATSSMLKVSDEAQR
jgi:Na+/proline symporter